MKKGISLVGIRDVHEIEEIIERFPSAFFELSYAMDESFLEKVHPLICGRVASVHSLCPRREFFPNFASSDPHVLSWSEKEVLRDAQTALRFSADILVLHPGYLLPVLIPSESGKRIALMEGDELKPYIGIRDGAICRPDYTESDGYRKAFNLMIPHLVRLSEKLSLMGLTLAVENLNPRAGYMLLRPEEMIELAEKTELCFTLDIGHLWVSSELFRFDFLDAVRSILSTGHVRTTHLHSNPSSRKNSIYSDSHQSIDRFSLPFRETLSLIEHSGANMILETVEEPMHNLSILFSW